MKSFRVGIRFIYCTRRAFAAGLLDSPDQAQGKKDVMICPDLFD